MHATQKTEGAFIDCVSSGASHLLAVCSGFWFCVGGTAVYGGASLWALVAIAPFVVHTWPHRENDYLQANVKLPAARMLLQRGSQKAHPKQSKGSLSLCFFTAWKGGSLVHVTLQFLFDPTIFKMWPETGHAV